MENIKTTIVDNYKNYATEKKLFIPSVFLIVFSYLYSHIRPPFFINEVNYFLIIKESVFYLAWLNILYNIGTYIYDKIQERKLVRLIKTKLQSLTDDEKEFLKKLKGEKIIVSNSTGRGSHDFEIADSLVYDNILIFVERSNQTNSNCLYKLSKTTIKLLDKNENLLE